MQLCSSRHPSLVPRPLQEERGVGLFGGGSGNETSRHPCDNVHIHIFIVLSYKCIQYFHIVAIFLIYTPS